MQLCRGHACKSVLNPLLAGGRRKTDHKGWRGAEITRGGARFNTAAVRGGLGYNVGWGQLRAGTSRVPTPPLLFLLLDAAEVVGPSTRVPSHTSVCSGRLRCWRCSVCSVFLRDPLTLILLFSQSFFLPLNLNLHSLTCLRRRLSMHLTLNPLGSLFELSQQKSVTRFPPDVWQAFFCRSVGAPICPRSKSHALLLQDVHRSFG